MPEEAVAEGVPQMETAEKDLMMPEGLAAVLKARDRRMPNAAHCWQKRRLYLDCYS